MRLYNFVFLIVVALLACGLNAQGISRQADLSRDDTQQIAVAKLKERIQVLEASLANRAYIELALGLIIAYLLWRSIKMVESLNKPYKQGKADTSVAGT